MKSYMKSNGPRLLVAVLAVIALSAGIIPDASVAGAVATMPDFGNIGLDVGAGALAFGITAAGPSTRRS